MGREGRPRRRPAKLHAAKAYDLARRRAACRKRGIIDATIVPLVLVPAAMELMGNANWWAPDWLKRHLPTIRVDTAKQQPAPASARAHN